MDWAVNREQEWRNFVGIPSISGASDITFKPAFSGGVIVTVLHHGEQQDGACTGSFNILSHEAATLLKSQLEACLDPDSVAAERVRSGDHAERVEEVVKWVEERNR